MNKTIAASCAISILCIISFSVLMLKNDDKKKTYRRLAFLLLIIVSVLSVGFIHIQTKSVDGFERFSVDDISKTSKLMETVISDVEHQIEARSGIKTQYFLISKFNLHFKEGTFQNMQFGLVTNNGGMEENTCQINYEGKEFISSATLFEADEKNLIDIEIIRTLIQALDVPKIMADNNGSKHDSIDISYAGISMPIAENSDCSGSYCISDVKMLPISEIDLDIDDYCYVFYIRVGESQIQILHPVEM